jgi:hypothetical protein
VSTRTQEDIFLDPFAVELGRPFDSSPKVSERQIAAITAAMLSGLAACVWRNDVDRTWDGREQIMKNTRRKETMAVDDTHDRNTRGATAFSTRTGRERWTRTTRERGTRGEAVFP